MKREKIVRLFSGLCCSVCKCDFEKDSLFIKREDKNLLVIQVVCQNCGKIFYQSLDKCCYCGSSFDLSSYHQNWRKWYNSTRSNDFNFVKYSGGCFNSPE